jgi:uncharacterized membrane protein
MESGASSPGKSTPNIASPDGSLPDIAAPDIAALDIGLPSQINPQPRWKWKTPLFAVVVILTNAFGNFFLARGMRALPALGSPADLIVAIFTPWVGLGIALLITWLLSRMMFLSFADLSYMLPLTALGYVLSAVLGHVFLKEQITTQRWLGTAFIMMGTMLVGTGNTETAHRATSPADAAAEVVDEVAEEIRHTPEHGNATAAPMESERPGSDTLSDTRSNPRSHQ